jgi:AcrR family transcriptional regulator
MKRRGEKQQRILEAAIKLFAEKGYHGTATSAIAKEAMVAEGTIFKYYATKKQLLREVLEYIVHETAPSIFKNSLEEVIAKCGTGDAKAVIKQLLAEKVEDISRNVNCIKIIVNEIQYHEDLKGEYLECLLPDFIKGLEGVYTMGVNNGVFRDINPHTAVRSFMGMFVLMTAEKNLLNKSLDISQELDTVLDIYMNGVIIRKEGV